MANWIHQSYIDNDFIVRQHNVSQDIVWPAPSRWSSLRTVLKKPYRYARSVIINMELLSMIIYSINTSIFNFIAKFRGRLPMESEAGFAMAAWRNIYSRIQDSMMQERLAAISVDTLVEVNRLANEMNTCMEILEIDEVKGGDTGIVFSGQYTYLMRLVPFGMFDLLLEQLSTPIQGHISSDILSAIRVFTNTFKALHTAREQDQEEAVSVCATSMWMHIALFLYKHPEAVSKQRWLTVLDWMVLQIMVGSQLYTVVPPSHVNIRRVLPADAPPAVARIGILLQKWQEIAPSRYPYNIIPLLKSSYNIREDWESNRQVVSALILHKLDELDVFGEGDDESIHFHAILNEWERFAMAIKEAWDPAWGESDVLSEDEIKAKICASVEKLLPPYLKKVALSA